MMPGMPPFGPPPPPPEVIYEQAALNVNQRMHQDLATHHALVDDLNAMTSNEYLRQMRKRFTLATKESVQDVDWRVPRMMVCKDPRYNNCIPFPFAQEAMERKQHDGQVLQDQFAREAYAKSKKEMVEMKSEIDGVPCEPPPIEAVRKKHVPFIHAVPNYERDDDLWQRRLELRSMDEAMRGDVSQPLPRPVLFAEDMDNFRAGKYVKDDCPIA